MEPGKIVRKACVVAYNLGYDDFMKLFDMDKNYYALEKFNFMKDNFASWYCDLDSQNSRRFMDFVMQQED